MKPKARFIASAVKTAKSDIPALPFERVVQRSSQSARVKKQIENQPNRNSKVSL
ncbi:hypothetical protein RB2083_700 [Rhodobacteraceae bacterium HTCC2083]|jgi:hypothetical protein|nr:hypothetical protein RB2083_700 [Rhodobacteraceae bacterium HTCC2083]